MLRASHRKLIIAKEVKFTQRLLNLKPLTHEQKRREDRSPPPPSTLYPPPLLSSTPVVLPLSSLFVQQRGRVEHRTQGFSADEQPIGIYMTKAHVAL